MMKDIFESYMEDNRTRQKDSVNGMMGVEFVEAQEEEQSATFRFTVLPWEANRYGKLHGGIMGTMLDHSCGLAVSGYTGFNGVTLSMSVDYIRSATVGDHLLCKATLVSTGRRVIRVRGELYHESTGELVATCSATFYNKGEHTQTTTKQESAHV